MAANLKQLIQDFIVPEFRALQGDIKRLDDKVDNLDKRLSQRFDDLDKRLSGQLTSLEREMNARFQAADSRFDALAGRFDSLERGLAVAIDLHERIASLEAKIGLGR